MENFSGAKGAGKVLIIIIIYYLIIIKYFAIFPFSSFFSFLGVDI